MAVAKKAPKKKNEFLRLEELRAEIEKGEKQYVVINQSWMELHNNDENVAFVDAIKAEEKDPRRFWTDKGWRKGICHEGPHYFVVSE